MKKALIFILLVTFSINGVKCGSDDSGAPTAPAFSPDPETVYKTEQSVAISSQTPGATIKYTLDNTDPRTSPTAITAATGTSSVTINVFGTKTIKAYAFKTGAEDCGVSCCEYVIARISLRKTGQTTEYRPGDDGYYQRGVTWPNPRFTDNGNGTIIDNLTGLMWQRVPLSKLRTWNEAIDYCNNLELGGYTDWRLPNQLELESLINYGQADNAEWLNSRGFSNVQNWSYWSSGTYALNTGLPWYVHIKHGCVLLDKKIRNINYLIAVRDSGLSGAIKLPKTGQTTEYRPGDDGYYQRGVTWPNPRFTDNGNGTITDNLTGLMWQRVPLSKLRTWNEAIDYCNNLKHAGYIDWRLPNHLELESLINYGQADNAEWLNSRGFSNVQNWSYWSSGTCARSTGLARYVPMRGGNFDHGSKHYDGRYVIAVRSGQ